MNESLRINRAPVLTLWAAVVGECLGLPRDTALTCGQAVAGMTAYAKGVRLGIYAAPETRPVEPPPSLPPGVKGPVTDVHLLGRRVHVAETDSGRFALSKGALVKPESVERYLRGKFGEHLAEVRAAMIRLAKSLPPDELAERAFDLYVQFRPEVPSDERGWGAKGVLDRAKIDALAGRGGR